MKRFVLLNTFAIACWFGCAGRGSAPESEHVDIVEHTPSKFTLLISKREWGGITGPHGYVGNEIRHYKAELNGTGPTFINPRFQDNPPDNKCVGKIILDGPHSTVTLDMRR